MVSSLVMLDTNVVAVALPTIAHTLNAEFADMQWVITATPTGSTRKIPELLPFTIRFAYSKDGTPIREGDLPEDNIRR